MERIESQEGSGQDVGHATKVKCTERRVQCVQLCIAQGVGRSLLSDAVRARFSRKVKPRGRADSWATTYFL